MPGNQEALRIDMSPNAAIRDYLSGSKPRMHSFEAVSWISCSRFKHCAMVRQAAIDFNLNGPRRALAGAFSLSGHRHVAVRRLAFVKLRGRREP